VIKLLCKLLINVKVNVRRVTGFMLLWRHSLGTWLRVTWRTVTWCWCINNLVLNYIHSWQWHLYMAGLWFDGTWDRIVAPPGSGPVLVRSLCLSGVCARARKRYYTWKCKHLLWSRYKS